MSSASESPSAPRLHRTLTLWDLVFYGIVLIQPTAPMPLYGVVCQEAKGHVVTTVLIGETLMRQDDVAAATAALIGGTFKLSRT